MSALAPAFIRKLYQFVGKHATTIRWNESGSGIVLAGSDAQLKVALKTGGLGSLHVFMRNLNLYFSSPDGGKTFANKYFTRGRPELLSNIEKMKVPKKPRSRGKKSAATPAFSEKTGPVQPSDKCPSSDKCSSGGYTDGMGFFESQMTSAGYSNDKCGGPVNLSSDYTTGSWGQSSGYSTSSGSCSSSDSSLTGFGSLTGCDNYSTSTDDYTSSWSSNISTCGTADGLESAADDAADIWMGAAFSTSDENAMNDSNSTEPAGGSDTWMNELMGDEMEQMLAEVQPGAGGTGDGQNEAQTEGLPVVDEDELMSLDLDKLVQEINEDEGVRLPQSESMHQTSSSSSPQPMVTDVPKPPEQQVSEVSEAVGVPTAVAYPAPADSEQLPEARVTSPRLPLATLAPLPSGSEGACRIGGRDALMMSPRSVAGKPVATAVAVRPFQQEPRHNESVTRGIVDDPPPVIITLPPAALHHVSVAHEQDASVPTAPSPVPVASAGDARGLFHDPGKGLPLELDSDFDGDGDLFDDVTGNLQLPLEVILAETSGPTNGDADADGDGSASPLPSKTFLKKRKAIFMPGLPPYPCDNPDVPLKLVSPSPKRMKVDSYPYHAHAHAHAQQHVRHDHEPGVKMAGAYLGDPGARAGAWPKDDHLLPADRDPS